MSGRVISVADLGEARAVVAAELPRRHTPPVSLKVSDYIRMNFPYLMLMLSTAAAVAYFGNPWLGVLVTVVTAAREFVWAKQWFQKPPSRLNADAQPVQPPRAEPATPELLYALAVPKVKALPIDQLLPTLEQAIDQNDLPLVKALLEHGFLAFGWEEKLIEVMERKMAALGEKAADNQCLITVYERTTYRSHSSQLETFQKKPENSSFLKNATAANEQESSKRLTRTESQQTYLKVQAFSPEAIRTKLLENYSRIDEVQAMIEYRAKDLGPMDFAVAFLTAVRELNSHSYVRIDAERQGAQIDECLQKMLTGWLTQHPNFFQQETLAIELFHALLHPDLQQTRALFLEKAKSNSQLHELLNEMLNPQRETEYERSPNGDNNTPPADRIMGLDRTNLFHGKFASVNYRSLGDVLLPDSDSEITETSRKCSRFYSLLPVSSVFSWLKNLRVETAIKNELAQAMANAVPDFFETALCVGAVAQDDQFLRMSTFQAETFILLAKTMQNPSLLARAVIHKYCTERGEEFPNFKNHFKGTVAATAVAMTAASGDRSKDQKS